MLIIQRTDQLSDDAITFVKYEWIVADKVHFGREIKWQKEKQALTASDNDEIVGVIELTIQAGVMYIDELIVASHRQGQGIGTQLMQKAEELAREKHLHKIYLDTGSNWPAVKFYENLGYQQTGILSKHYENLDYIIFTKFL